MWQIKFFLLIYNIYSKKAKKKKSERIIFFFKSNDWIKKNLQIMWCWEIFQLKSINKKKIYCFKVTSKNSIGNKITFKLICVSYLKASKNAFFLNIILETKKWAVCSAVKCSTRICSEAKKWSSVRSIFRPRPHMHVCLRWASAESYNLTT